MQHVPPTGMLRNQPRASNFANAVGTTYSVQAVSTHHTPAHCTSVAPGAIINALYVFGSNQNEAYRYCILACSAAAAASLLGWVPKVFCWCCRGGARSVSEVPDYSAEVLQQLGTADIKHCSSVIVIDAWSATAPSLIILG
jgi:hypothetical protein